MARTTSWKNFERRVADLLGGRRVPVTGIDRHGADVIVGVFCCIQCKYRRGIPRYVREWLDGIRGTAAARNQDPEVPAATGEIGIVVWKEHGDGDDDALVVMTLGDWRALHGA